MSAEGFQILNKEKNDIWIIERDFLKLYHQHGANVNEKNQSIIFFFGKNFDYTQLGTGYCQFEIRVRNADKSNFIVADPHTNEFIRLVTNAFAVTTQDTRISTSSGRKQNNFVGPISRIMKLSMHRGVDLSTYFDKDDESEVGINY